MNAAVHRDAASFLARARSWLELAEDEHNLILGIATELAETGLSTEGADAPFFATVEDDGDVVGCAFRTPPHVLCVTRMPATAIGPVVDAVAARFTAVPAVLGPGEVARAVAEAWVERHGGRTEAGMQSRIYRLDAVSPPVGVPGHMHVAAEAHQALVDAWTEGFTADTRAEFAVSPARRAAWLRSGQLFLWDDGGPAAMAVATGATRRGMRIGYVYTPPERRRHGYASALTAALSQRLLDEGFSFCMLYTDLSNTTSNAIYPRVGYRPVCDVEDVLIEAAT